MKYSEMSPVQRKLLLDVEESYPLRVTFLGKVGILTMDQVTFLKEHQIDFDVDDRQAAAVLGDQAVGHALDKRTAHRVAGEIEQGVQDTVGTILPTERQVELQQLEGEAVGEATGILATLPRPIRRLLRL